ncbi:MAG TPA: hypothetical protein PLX89_26840 [Verrucomicrobiota bacterium]|nr:hypothetical protein [Verrucomicrobiales bacterium]HRI16625.1 hypothetical protein [Verrucomicrobiota bacterium]
MLILILGLWVGNPAWAVTFLEDFADDPTQRGWVASGNHDLFAWNASLERLNVTWDTTNGHSFFARPLGVTLTRVDDFSFSFDLALTEAAGGVRNGRPGAMQVAVGLVNLAQATSNNYRRGAGQARDTLEFNWFPAGLIPGYGEVEPTLSLVSFDNAGRVRANFDFPFEWELSQALHVEVVYRAAERTVSMTARRSGGAAVTISLVLDEAFGPITLDAFAVMVWDETTSFGDSLRAQGWLDNVVITVPDPPIGELRWVAAGVSTVEFESRSGWRYALEASGDLQDWQTVGAPSSGTGGSMSLSDLREAIFSKQFYRVRVEVE